METPYIEQNKGEKKLFTNLFTYVNTKLNTITKGSFNGDGSTQENSKTTDSLLVSLNKTLSQLQEIRNTGGENAKKAQALYMELFKLNTKTLKQDSLNAAQEFIEQVNTKK